MSKLNSSNLQHFKIVVHFNGEMGPAGVQVVEAAGYSITTPGGRSSWVRFYDTDGSVTAEFNGDRTVAIFKIDADAAREIEKQTSELLKARTAAGNGGYQ